MAYIGYSKSRRAVLAEQEDKYPLTKACKVLAKKLNWSQAKAKAFLLDFGTKEWHHTSSYYNRTDYNDVSDWFIKEYEEKLQAFTYRPRKKS